MGLGCKSVCHLRRGEKGKEGVDIYNKTNFSPPKKTCSKPFTVLPPDSFVLLFLLGSVWITLDSRIQLSNISDLSQFLQSRRAMHYIILKSKQI